MGQEELEAVRAATHHATPGRREERTLMIGLIVGACAWLHIAIIAASIGIWQWWSILPVLFFVAAAWDARRRMASRKRAYRTALLSHGRCPACAYKLSNDPEADGCTICSECGGAWRVAAVRTSGGSSGA